MKIQIYVMIKSKTYTRVRWKEQKGEREASGRGKHL